MKDYWTLVQYTKSFRSEDNAAEIFARRSFVIFRFAKTNLKDSGSTVEDRVNLSYVRRHLTQHENHRFPRKARSFLPTEIRQRDGTESGQEFEVGNHRPHEGT